MLISRSLLLLLFTTGVASAADSRTALPGPAPQSRGYGLLARSADCESCHATIFNEWRDSYHKKAFSDAAYRRALKREPTAFCRRCHAPESAPLQFPSALAQEHGVACVTCHMPSSNREIVTGISHAEAAAKAHAVRRDPRLSSDDACLRCHEFQFPDAKKRARPEFMQRTIFEHQASAHKDKRCIDCHMPKMADGHLSHRFLGGHDEATLRTALRVNAKTEESALKLELIPERVGHAFPTGDLFRRIVVEVAFQDAADVTLMTTRKDLMRKFMSERQMPAAAVRTCLSDTRLFGPTVLAFPLRTGTKKVSYNVRYQRVAFPFDQLGGPAALDGEVELTRGTLLLP